MQVKQQMHTTAHSANYN